MFTWGDTGFNSLFRQYKNKSSFVIWINMQKVTSVELLAIKIKVARGNCVKSLSDWNKAFLSSSINSCYCINTTDNQQKMLGEPVIFSEQSQQQRCTKVNGPKSSRNALSHPVFASTQSLHLCRSESLRRSGYDEEFSFPERQHGVDVPQQVPHLIHQNLHLLVLLTYFLHVNHKTRAREAERYHAVAKLTEKILINLWLYMMIYYVHCS